MKVHKKIGSQERFKEMFQKINKVKLNESFDNPKAKDEKYLNKGGDKKDIDVQANKYDDGVREPRERNIQVKDKSVEKLKGDDKPITEGIIDVLKREFNDLVAGWEQMKPQTSQFRQSAMGPGGHEGGAELARLKQNKAEQLLNIIRQYGEDSPEAKAFGEGEEEDVAVLSTDDVGDITVNGTEEIEDNGEEAIVGGLADDESPADFDPKQILLGMEVEMEHTSNPKEALEIAMDHLVEDPAYYGNEGENPEMEAQNNAEIDASEIEDEIIGTEIENTEEESPEHIEDDDLRVNMNWLETIKPKSVDDMDVMKEYDDFNPDLNPDDPNMVDGSDDPIYQEVQREFDPHSYDRGTSSQHAYDMYMDYLEGEKINGNNKPMDFIFWQGDYANQNNDSERWSYE